MQHARETMETKIEKYLLLIVWWTHYCIIILESSEMSTVNKEGEILYFVIFAIILILRVLSMYGRNRAK